MEISFNLNEKQVSLNINPTDRLVHVLRDQGLLLSKEGCLSGKCGACMVLLNDKPVPSCIIPVFKVQDARVITLEKFMETKYYQDIQQGFAKSHVELCGFCNAGKIFVTHYFLSENIKPSRPIVKQFFSGNLCRCTSFEELYAGIKQAGIIRRNREYAR